VIRAAASGAQPQTPRIFQYAVMGAFGIRQPHRETEYENESFSISKGTQFLRALAEFQIGLTPSSTLELVRRVLFLPD
jgi:hypothetical protein